jgi:hypothetical protein
MLRSFASYEDKSVAGLEDANTAALLLLLRADRDVTFPVRWSVLVTVRCAHHGAYLNYKSP